jgi:hypothetical protein
VIHRRAARRKTRCFRRAQLVEFEDHGVGVAVAEALEPKLDLLGRHGALSRRIRRADLIVMDALRCALPGARPPRAGARGETRQRKDESWEQPPRPHRFISVPGSQPLFPSEIT